MDEIISMDKGNHELAVEVAVASQSSNVIGIDERRAALPADVATPSREARRPLSKAEEMVQQFLALCEQESNPESLLFHSADLEPFARIRVDGHFENWPLKSAVFQNWLNHAFYKLVKTTPSNAVLQTLMREFSGKALFDGEKYPIHIRVAEYENRIYLDLCDDEWRVVKIDATGWNVVDEYPVRFKRSPAMLSLPVPEPGGKVDDIYPFLNVRAEHDRLLVLGWIVSTFFPSSPHPILGVHGPQGAGKSTLSQVIRLLTDPSKAPARACPRDERDLVISARHSHLVSFDNLSRISDSLSDSLCRLATGSGFATRKLYTDSEEIIFEAKRSVIVNSIEEGLATRSDLLDRMILIAILAMKKSERRPERELWAEFRLLRPRLLGALLEVVSATLRAIPTIALPDPPRMADFAVIGCAAEEALGFGKGQFIEAYNRNRIEAMLSALDAAPVAAEIVKLMEMTKGQWQGTCGELLGRLNRIADESATRDAQWPRSAKALSGVLDRIRPNLEQAAGVRLERLVREGGTGRRILRLSSSHRHNVTT